MVRNVTTNTSAAQTGNRFAIARFYFFSKRIPHMKFSVRDYGITGILATNYGGG